MRIERKIKENIVYLYLYIFALLKNKKNKKMVFMVDSCYPGFSGDLRGNAIANELKKLGWSTLVISEYMNIEKVLKIINRFNPEYIYMQMLRSKNNDIKYFENYKCIIDVDDADFLDDRSIEKFKENIPKAYMCFAGSENVENWLKKYNTNTYVVWTGVKPNKNKKIVKNIPVVSWACSDPFAYTIEAEFVKKLIVELKKRKEFSFYLVGVRDLKQGEKWLKEIDDKMLNIRQFPFLKYRNLNKLMREVDIGLAPLFPNKNPFSSGKSFGKVLAYLNNNAVVIASDCLEHSKFFTGKNGVLCSDEIEEWIKSIEKLIDNREEMINISKQAKLDFLEKLSVKAAANKIDKFLR